MVAKTATELTTTQKELLNTLQWDFPLVEEPFSEIGARLGLTEEEVIGQIATLKDEAIIRELNAIFDTRRLGYKSSLVAVRAPEDRVDDVAAVISEHPGVSHNYKRDHYFNIWFTLAVPPESDLESELDSLATRAGAETYRILPTKHLFKIGVKLDMTKDEEKLEPEQRVAKKSRPTAGPLTDEDRAFVRELQEDVSLVPRPFDGMAKRLGMTVPELLEKIQWFQDVGLMRRFAAVLRHQNAGFTSNGMVCWKVPEEQIRIVGEIAASFPQVSHCYQRPTYPDWPYSLFSMVHSRSDDKCRKIAEQISEKTGITEYEILFSTKEYKKERVRYFV